MERGSGLLVHISSLPGKYGIGTFGSEAKAFIDFLVDSKQKYWQLLPLNPTSIGDSPYQSFSAFALNPYFIDLDNLLNKKYLSKKDLKNIKVDDENFIDYGKIYLERFDILFDKNATEKAYPASITKAMTVLVALEQFNNYNDTLVITQETYDYLAAQDASMDSISQNSEVCK